MSTKKASDDAPRGYKKLLLEALALRAQGGKSAYQRIKLLVAVYKDRDFRIEAGNVDDFRAAEVLDEYVEDLALRFLELQAMVEHFPKESQWSEGKLRSMYKEVMEANGQPERDVQRRHKITLQQYAELEEKLKREAARVRQLQKENAQLKSELDQTKAQLRELKKEAREPVAA